MDSKSFELNKIETDEFRRTSAVLAINKRVGETSHDVVDQVRKKLRTRKVGHAGALDPFATGVLIILVGKYTKLSQQLMKADKEYSCKILLGISTDTQDPEGEIEDLKSKIKDYNKEEVEENLKKFEKGYEQRVPVFSSVKVEGKKLRELARKSESFKIDEKDNVTFVFSDERKVVVKLPKRKVEFTRFEITDLNSVTVSKLSDDLKNKVSEFSTKNSIDNRQLTIVNLIVGCSKGTYIRQLAEDIGKELGVPAMLLELERTKVGEVSLSDCVKVEDLQLG